MNNSIRTIKIEELLANKSMPTGMHFSIPKYQRGYRWKDTQVRQMLDDLDEFEYEKNNDDIFYCLQPLVVKKKEDGSWIVVDGQQRLTTIFIILTCIEKLVYKEKANVYTLKYDNQKDLWDCLDSLGDVDKDIYLDTSDVDCYHITNAYITVKNWFNNHEKDLKSIGGDIRDKLRSYARFIWYEINDDIEPEVIFSNINMGKIRLTNAELIKALFLKKDNYRGEDADHITTSQIKISTAWDNMEAALQDDNLWMFLTGDGVFKNLQPRIELIFKIMAKDLIRKHPEFYVENEEANNKETYTFIIFNKEIERIKRKNSEEDKLPYSELLEAFWRNIVDYFNMFIDWYNNREWYHLIGFLLANKNNQSEVYFEELSQLYKENTKSSFVRELKDRIINELSLVESGNELTAEAIIEYLNDLEYKNKEEQRSKIRNTLLLFNVITMQENTDSEPRFPFRRYQKQNWDIEHIHSVTTEKPQNSKEREKWINDAALSINNTTTVPANLKTDVNNLIEKELYSDESAEEYAALYDRIVSFFAGGMMDDGTINEISNLTLLDATTNRSYKNAIFPVKRNVILGKSGKESFIPVCTKNVFLKYYSKDVTQMYLWGKNDRRGYHEAMTKTLYKYLRSEVE